jgi:hypothetical protein
MFRQGGVLVVPMSREEILYIAIMIIRQAQYTATDENKIVG